jgi:hypothetical protein
VTPPKQLWRGDGQMLEAYSAALLILNKAYVSQIESYEAQDNLVFNLAKLGTYTQIMEN